MISLPYAATSPAVITFSNGSLTLRAIDESGEPWFFAKDACDALGYANVSQALADHVDPEDKHIVSIGLPGRTPWIISEAGLFVLILRSKKPEAKPFQRWVTKNVLPSIRKHGAYALGAERLSQSAQENLYRTIHAMTQEALRRYDLETEHDHWVSPRKQKERSEAATRKVSREMGLPIELLRIATGHGVAVAVCALSEGKA